MSRHKKQKLFLDIAVRFLSLVLTVSLCTMYLFYYSAKAHAIELKTFSVVNEDTIMLSDIFDGLSFDQDSILGRAPTPGESMTLNARTLMRVASAYNIDWKPLSIRETVTVNRAATIVDTVVIDQVIQSAIGERKSGGNFKVQYNAPIPAINISPDQAPTAEIVQIDYKDSQRWFNATVAVPSAAQPEKTFQVFGTVEDVVQVPVLKNAVQAGRVIRERDIQWVDYPSHRLGANQIVNAADLIGMEPRQLIRPNSVVIQSQIQKPEMIKRGERITILYQDGPLMLSATGKALEAGSEGDYIRVVNSSSNRTIEVQVEDFKIAKAAF